MKVLDAHKMALETMASKRASGEFSDTIPNEKALKTKMDSLICGDGYDADGRRDAILQEFKQSLKDVRAIAYMQGYEDAIRCANTFLKSAYNKGVKGGWLKGEKDEAD